MIPYRDEATPLLLFCVVHGIFLTIYRAVGAVKGRTGRNRRTVYLAGVTRVLHGSLRNCAALSSEQTNGEQPGSESHRSLAAQQHVDESSGSCCVDEEQLCPLWKCPPVTLPVPNRSPLQNVVTSMSGFRVHSKSLGFSVKTFLFFVPSCVRGVFHEKRMTDGPRNLHQ